MLPPPFSSLFELVFAYAAEGAGKIFGDVLPFRAGRDAVVGIARRFVVLVAANAADILCHRYLSFFDLYYYYIRNRTEYKRISNLLAKKAILSLTARRTESAFAPFGI